MKKPRQTTLLCGGITQLDIIEDFASIVYNIWCLIYPLTKIALAPTAWSLASHINSKRKDQSSGLIIDVVVRSSLSLSNVSWYCGVHSNGTSNESKWHKGNETSVKPVIP